MRQFIHSGPELPYEVLQAHEEGRLVFFCGAGVSYYTGLPDFRELVTKTFGACSHPLAATLEKAVTPEDWAFHNDRLDQALHLLEQKVSREAARRAALRILSAPPIRGTGTVRLHKALLDLAELPAGGFRLVTTNFDDRFYLARRQAGPVAEAPRIGWPRQEAWKHLTYLHGRISASDEIGEDLILSSGDFGRAYMTEGWAARFVVELFREYTVLFVGYSLNDPVLRYIVDGLATDMRDGRFRAPFVLAGYKDGNEGAVMDEWKSKGVCPIPFSTGPDGKDYSLQNETLLRWAENYKGGLGSRIAVVRDLTGSDYVKTPDDLELKNVVWALSKSDSSVARAFADMEPAPKISWLAPISEHLIPSGVSSADVSLAALPSPPRKSGDKDGHHLAPLAGLNAACIGELPINPLTFKMGLWLRKHRENQELVDWVNEHGGVVHPAWARVLAMDLEKVREPWRTYWSIIISGATVPPCASNDDFYFRKQFRGKTWPAEGDQTILDSARAWVTPRKPLRLQERVSEPESLEDLAHFELNLSGVDVIKTALQKSTEDEYRQHLADLADQITSRLIDALELAKTTRISVVGQLNHIRIPSIADMPRNDGLEKWEVLVRLARIAFDCLHQQDPTAAASLAARWRLRHGGSGQHILGRLSAYALSKIDALNSDEVVDFLLDNHGHILWDFGAWPEVAHFIRNQLPELTKKAQQRVVRAVRDGPSRNTFPQYSGTNDEFSEFANALKMRRTLALLRSGVTLPASLTALVDEQDQDEEAEDVRHPEVEFRRVDPKDANALLGLSAEEVATAVVAERGWDGGHQLADLIEKNLPLGLDAISELSQRECDNDLWEIGLGGLPKAGRNHRERKVILERIRLLGTDRPQWLTLPVVRPIGRTLQSFAEEMSRRQRGLFMEVWDLAWNSSAAMPADDEDGHDRDPVQTAINVAGGILAEALLDIYFTDAPTAGSGIANEFRQRFDEMWDGAHLAHKYARVIFASRLLWIHRIDPDWAKRTIIPALSDHDERLGLWAAFLWPGQWDVELATDIEAAFRDVVPALADGPEGLAERASEWFATVLMSAPDLYSKRTKQEFFRHADADALGSLAWVLEKSLEDAEDRGPELWRLRVKPVIEGLWPADRNKINSSISSKLLQVAVACRSEFPDAVRKLADKNLIIPGAAESIFWALPDQDDQDAYDIVNQHPEELLTMLRLGIGDDIAEYRQNDLAALLDRIMTAAPDVAERQEYRTLRELAARG